MLRSMLALAVCLFALPQVSRSGEDAPAAPGRLFTDVFHEQDADLVSHGTNPFFVLEPGYRLVLVGREHGKPVELVITVLDEVRVVAGVETRVVEERETEGGALAEVSRNFFAISKRTNSVYYFGEEVDEYEDGKVSGHPGSWSAGKDGARYGLMLPGTVLLGARYMQEVAPKVAMDRAEVVSLSGSVETGEGTKTECLEVEETTPLEPGAREVKRYAPGIGLVTDGALVLREHGPVKR